MNADLRDTINEAFCDAICDGEGRGDAEHLVHHLAKRGLHIVTGLAVDPALKSDRLRPAFAEWYQHCFGTAPDAVDWASDQYEGATFRSIIEWLEQHGVIAWKNVR